MKSKYFNDAIIGNKNIRATLSKRGEILRLYYPSIDYRQFIDELMVGLKINDSRLINLHENLNFASRRFGRLLYLWNKGRRG